MKLQSSAAEISNGLDLWLASIIKNKSDGTIPWNSAQDMYSTINSIKAGSSAWKTFKFRYTSPKPEGPVPKWMEVEYELNTRNILTIVEQQLATTQFDGQFDYSPYQEFGPDGQRIWSNLMSALWAWKQAVSNSISFTKVFIKFLFQDKIEKDVGTAAHKAMFVPILAGSDKTTVSVATGHQEYHPVYTSISNISNTARRAHGNGVMPVAFLPIPKGLFKVLDVYLN